MPLRREKERRKEKEEGRGREEMEEKRRRERKEKSGEGKGKGRGEVIGEERGEERWFTSSHRFFPTRSQVVRLSKGMHVRLCPIFF